MSFVLDIIALAIIGVSVFFAYKKGLIKTLFSVVGGIIAIVLAVAMSTPVANWLNEKYVGPSIHETVLKIVNGADLSQDYDEALKSVDVVGKLREMPESLRTALEKLHVDVEGIVASAEQSKTNSVEVKEKLINSIAEPVSDVISKTVALIGLAIIFFIALLVVTHLLDAVFRILPFGKTANKTGGIIFGVIRALLILMIFGAIAYGFARGNVLISSEDLDKTFILKFVNAFNPILNILK